MFDTTLLSRSVQRAIVAIKTYPQRSYVLVLFVFLLWSFRSLLGSGYVFTVDTVMGPNQDIFVSRFFGFAVPVYGGDLPLFSALAFIQYLFGSAVMERLLLFTVLFACGLTPLILFSRIERWLYASVLILFNPFVYVRFLAGHWRVIWGLAALPLVLHLFSSYLNDGGKRPLVFTLLAILVLGFSSHLLYISGLLIVALVLFKTLEERTVTPIKRAIVVVILSLSLSMYWLGPVFAARQTLLRGITTADILAFAPQIEPFSALYAIASMHGFWRGGYVYADDIVSGLVFLYIPLLFFAIHGFVIFYRDSEHGYIVKALGVTGIVALLLGSGTNGPTASLYRWLFEHIPLFAGLRDPQKFVALLVLVYAYLGALGVSDLLSRMRTLERGQWLSIIVLGTVLLVPIGYASPMATGYAGQMQASEYPDGWYEVNRFLANDRGNYNVLFLPWHQFMDYSWVSGDRKRIAVPARRFFTDSVIQSDNSELPGVYSNSNNPVSHYVEFLFGLGPRYERKDITNMGELLAHINTKYVLLTKETDWQYYDAIMRNQSDLTLVMENDHFKIYRNDHEVDRAYSVNRIVYVRNWNHFVNLSRREDTTESIYVINRTKAGQTIGVSEQRRSLGSTKHHPARYGLEGTSHRVTVFSQSQRTANGQWYYNGNEPEYEHLGFQPAFTSSSEDGVVRYAPFYQVALPSYIISLLAVIVLLWYARSESLFAS